MAFCFPFFAPKSFCGAAPEFSMCQHGDNTSHACPWGASPLRFIQRESLLCFMMPERVTGDVSPTVPHTVDWAPEGRVCRDRRTLLSPNKQPHKAHGGFCFLPNRAGRPSVTEPCRAFCSGSIATLTCLGDGPLSTTHAQDLERCQPSQKELTRPHHEPRGSKLLSDAHPSVRP